MSKVLMYADAHVFPQTEIDTLRRRVRKMAHKKQPPPLGPR